MANMTYRELLARLQDGTPEELDQTVTVYVQELDEFHPVTRLGVSEDGDYADGILDHGHIYVEIEG